MPIGTSTEERLQKQWQGIGSWVDGGQQINPGTGAVVADTGALAAGAYLIAIHWRATVAASVNIQYRDAANATTNKQIDRQIGAAGHDDCILGSKITSILEGERVRVVNETVIAGNMRASIIAQEVVQTP